jgi:hypothetical protein
VGIGRAAPAAGPLGPGVAVEDADLDGDLDLAIAGDGLYRNDGDRRGDGGLRLALAAGTGLDWGGVNGAFATDRDGDPDRPPRGPTASTGTTAVRSPM